MNRPDLQRTADGTALIGDKRNDENKIVAQIQVLFLRFHNNVFDRLASRFALGERGRTNSAKRSGSSDGATNGLPESTSCQRCATRTS